MTQTVADIRDINYVLFELLKIEKLTENKKYSDFNQKTFEMIIKEARNFGLKEILPTYAEGDRQGVKIVDGVVKPPECYRRPFKLFVENEYTAMTEDPEVGGQGLPHVISTAANEYLAGSNFAFAAYTMMGHGAGKMIQIFGTEEQKATYLKNVYTGKWSGTMLLTEPEAGSDVGALTTTAKRNSDGSFSITGNKIFITSGDHDLVENIIHPVLARIEGAPAGTKGISLFIVPKFMVNEDGSLGERNDIFCTSLEEKMGIHGSATCSMSLGAKGDCKGFLLGEENKGMRVMFHMMNDARLSVGHQAFVHASTAYLYALGYARDRVQGRSIENFANHESPSVSIIEHPDVRRMLIDMKAHVEGMRMFVHYVAACFDWVEMAKTEEEKAKYKGMIDILTPILKTYNSVRGFDMCVEAMQLYGGAGYTKDYPIEQLVRDCKITSIYEGTDGIQAMDLLARKLPMNEGQVFLTLVAEMGKWTVEAKATKGLEQLGKKLDEAIKKLSATAMDLGQKAMSARFKTAFAHSVPFLLLMGDVILAWFLLWRAVVATEKLEAGAKNKDVPFYEGQVKNAEYFIQTIIPVTMGKMDAVVAGCNAAIDISNEAFGEK